jgi:hypothetical protein
MAATQDSWRTTLYGVSTGPRRPSHSVSHGAPAQRRGQLTAWPSTSARYNPFRALNAGSADAGHRPAARYDTAVAVPYITATGAMPRRDASGMATPAPSS